MTAINARDCLNGALAIQGCAGPHSDIASTLGPTLNTNASSQPPLTPNSTHTHTPQAPTCAPPPAKPRSPMKYCKAARAPTPAPIAPTPPSPAGRTPAPGTPPPSPALPLPPSPNAAHRSRRSQHGRPPSPPLSAISPVSPQPSTPKNDAQEAATYLRAPWHQAVRLSWENGTPAPCILHRPPASCTAPHARERRGNPSPAAPRLPDRQAPPRSPAARQPAPPRRSLSCLESAQNAALVPVPAPASPGPGRRYPTETECEGAGPVCSQDNQSVVTVVFEPDYSPRSTDSSRSRIWIVSDSVSTSLQPSQSTHTYSTQT